MRSYVGKWQGSNGPGMGKIEIFAGRASIVSLEVRRWVEWDLKNLIA